MVDADDGEKAATPALQPNAPPSAARPRTRSPEQPGDIQSYIGERLRQAFDDVAKQPVPDRFLELMAELDRS